MRKTVTSLFIAGLLGGSPALAGGERGAPLQKWAETLELSDVQRSELRQLHEEHMPRMREQHQKMRELRAAERELDPTADGFIARSRELAEERARIQVEAAMARAEHRQQMARILNADQRRKMAEARKQKMQGHGRYDAEGRRGDGPRGMRGENPMGKHGMRGD